ncbi:hypothetical protein HF888_01005 [Bermanella marisrubri]|uniref:Uncharacterized protein n=1 Tax=Bermanella marisrubri TaxID=207949 RepID=Q1N488_9GAMM|nr:hypothetical protein [Bermanella marisrubri]EAT12977.1 hypothetical protein RED65_14812 [Oceanobacter sp. RED65] [Bermanella marisrubri]QIZ82895.1 hypothetical protein HF888_01005 [Bermanella marisrubri]
MKRFSLKQLVFPLAASLLTACGSSDESDNDNNPTPNVDQNDNSSLVIDSTNAVYFASKDEDGTWHEMSQSEHVMEDGYLHIVYVCQSKSVYDPDTTRYKVISEETSYNETNGYNYQLCPAPKQDFFLNTENVSDGVVLKHQQDFFMYDDNHNEVDYVAIGYDQEQDQAYAYKRTLKIDEYDNSSKLEVDFRDTTYSQKTSHHKIPLADAWGYAVYHISPTNNLLLNFEQHNTDASWDITVEPPMSWQTSASKFKEEWSIRGIEEHAIRRLISEKPSYQANSFELEEPIFYINDLNVDTNTSSATINAPSYSPDGFIGAFYELSYIKDNVRFYFYADEHAGVINFDLLDFSSLPNFPNDKITIDPYSQPDFDAANLHLSAEYVNEWWVEYGSVGRESIYIPASRVETIIIEPKPIY